MKLNPRHSINCITGVAACAHSTLIWQTCDLYMWCLAHLLLTSTLIFHGAHVLGHKHWADTIFMKYDVSCVILSGVYILFRTMHDDLFYFAFWQLVILFSLWTMSFHPAYCHLPLNPLASVIHIAALRINLAVHDKFCDAS